MTLLFAFLFMLLVVAAMSVGVVFGRKPITGSCGGLKTLGLDSGCEICGGDPNQCDGESAIPSESKVPRAGSPGELRRAAALGTPVDDSAPKS